MVWIGKAIGAVFGYALLGGRIGWFGILAGVAIGHMFDKQFEKALGHGVNQAEVQAVFFEALFICMGHLAKRDGHVSEKEILMARQIMTHMQLLEAQRLRAIELFTEGKSLPHTDEVLERFKSLAGRNKNLLRMFVQLEFQAAYAEGPPEGEPYEYLKHIAEKLGFNLFEFESIARIFRAQYFFQQSQQSQNSGYSQYQNSQNSQNFHNTRTPKDQLKDAFGILGIPESSSKDEVKKAYRKQMNQYHPDKLVAKGLPESMMKAATEKTQSIKEAYELINQVKGW